MNVLVTYGSERGGTAGLAERIERALTREGHSVRCAAARDVRDLTGYDAVVLGGALYAMRWHADARRFVLRHAAALRARPVWFFSSGPLDDTARGDAIAPTPQVRQLMGYVGARGHITFGGRLTPDARGLLASRMARTSAGDWRDLDAVDAWALALSDQLGAAVHAATTRSFTPLPSRWLSVSLSVAAGASAVFGGACLVARPDGSALGMPLSLLAHTPFRTFLVPGLLLLVVVGAVNLAAAALQAARSDAASPTSFLAGSALTVWIVVEVAMLRGVHSLHVAYLLLGLAIAGVALRQMRDLLPPTATSMDAHHAVPAG